MYLSSDVTSPTRFEVASYGASPVVTQAAGPSVTIAQGQAVELTTSPVNESSGNTVTLTAYGQKMAQRFQLSSGPWTCGEVAIHVAKWGTPSDDVVVSLFSDNGADKPNALLGYGLIHPADIPSQSAAWRSAKLITPVTLANATKYHIVVSHGEIFGTISITSPFPRRRWPVCQRAAAPAVDRADLGPTLYDD